jgi:hypothetical protein
MKHTEERYLSSIKNFLDKIITCDISLSKELIDVYGSQINGFSNLKDCKRSINEKIQQLGATIIDWKLIDLLQSINLS